MTKHPKYRLIAISIFLATVWITSAMNAQELIGYWQLEETDIDADVLDSSGNEFHGIFEGEVDPNVDGAPGFGSGAYFDGVDGHVLIGPGDENGFGELTSDFSVVAWINPDQFDSKNRVFGSAPHGGAGWGWGTAGDHLELTTWGVKDYDDIESLELEEWTHAAIVLDEDFEAHFYINGEFVGTQTHPTEGLPTENDFYIGYACCGPEHFSGLLDEVGVFSGTLTEEQIVNAMTLGVSNFDGGGGVAGDYNDNGERDPDDIDILSAAIRDMSTDAKFDANGDGNVDAGDRSEWVEVLSNTYFGDSNFDGEFSSSDFVQVFGAAKYETGEAAGWADGDWNGDATFDSSDFVAAFTGAGYENGPREGGIMTVPEPSSLSLILFGLIGLARAARRK